MKLAIFAFFIFIIVNLLVVEVGAKQSSEVLKARLSQLKRSLKVDEKESGKVGVKDSIFLESQSRLSSKFKKQKSHATVTEYPISSPSVDSIGDYIAQMKEQSSNDLRSLEEHVANSKSKDDEQKGIKRMAKLMTQIQFLDQAFMKMVQASNSLNSKKNETIAANEQLIKQYIKEIVQPEMNKDERRAKVVASLKPNLEKAEEDVITEKPNSQQDFYNAYRTLQNVMITLKDKESQDLLMSQICDQYPQTAKKFHLFDKYCKKPQPEPVQQVWIEKDHSESPSFSLFEQSLSVKPSKE